MEGETMDLLKWIGSIGGVGAVFGFLMYLALRENTKVMRQDRKFMEDRLTGLLNEYNKATQESTKILTELFTWLRARNGNKN